MAKSAIIAVNLSFLNFCKEGAGRSILDNNFFLSAALRESITFTRVSRGISNFLVTVSFNVICGMTKPPFDDSIADQPEWSSVTGAPEGAPYITIFPFLHNSGWVCRAGLQTRLTGAPEG
ncbi:MAG: hypothetical protein PHN97_06325, partial [Smithellaceae bacterium]|nr:hypothetical protein [Smithellaceae bacterium]